MQEKGQTKIVQNRGKTHNVIEAGHMTVHFLYLKFVHSTIIARKTSGLIEMMLQAHNALNMTAVTRLGKALELVEPQHVILNISECVFLREWRSI